MALIFDTETTGLPTVRGANYTQLGAFESCRIVSISWACNDREPIYYIVKPDGFFSSPESVAIHGITHEMAVQNGVPFADIMQHLFYDIRRGITCIVAHNLEFDLNVLKSELYRRGMLELLRELEPISRFCTMLAGKRVMGIRKWPKLAELYQFLTKEEISNAHNALYDTIHCRRCYGILSQM